MQISFLYIQEYGQVKDLGLNFNPKFRYVFHAQKGEISITKTVDFTEKFYEKLDAHIMSVSAIIGENGVGKTTILNFIKNNFTDGTGGVHSPCIVGIYHPEQDTHEIFRYKMDEPTLSESYENVRFSELVNNFHEVNFRNRFYSINAFEKLTFINYSGFLDLTQNEGEYGSSFNITTSYLAYNASKKQTLEDWRFNLNEIETFRTQEIERQLRFYFKHKELLPFAKPGYIKISINKFKSNQLFKNLDEQLHLYKKELDKLDSSSTELQVQNEIEKYKKYIAEIDTFNSKVNELHKLLDAHSIGLLKEDIYTQLLISLLYSWVWSINYLHLTNSLLEKALDEIKEEGIIDKDKIMQKLFELAELSDLTEEHQAKSIDYKNILPSIANLLEICSNKGEWYEDFIQLVDENEKILSDFFKFQSNNSFANFVDFFWPLSSGQQSLFSMYSRFYDIVHRTNQFDNIEIKENILIILDEAEITLHPEWQRSFFDNFLKVISKIFIGKKIQIILTSHSPFVISDLVNSQINFIEKNEIKGKSQVVENPMMNKKSTFGANISTLLNDAFFMKDGFIGGIALTQMDQFIDFILNSEISLLKRDYEYIDWFINQIGEPIIKNKVIHLIENRLSIDLLNSKERMDEIEKRLNNLEKPKDD